MSVVPDFLRPRRILQGPIEKKLAVESDKRLYRTVGAGQVAGAWFVAWALTVPLVIPLPPPEDPPIDPGRNTFDPTPRALPEGLRPKPNDPIAKAKPRQNTGAKARSRNPVKEGGNLQVNPITSVKDGLHTAGADIIKDVMKNIDLEKIEKVEGLRRTEPTVIAGRKGAKTEAYNEPYGDGNGKYEIDLIPSAPPGRIEPGRKVSDVIAGTRSEITVSSEGRFRSSDEILRVVKAGTPGLRHLYNTHLKANPGLGGKVTIRFAVAPSGLVVDAAIASGTTGASRFEEQVLAKIRTWRFDPIKAVGNDIVTVPFNFSE